MASKKTIEIPKSAEYKRPVCTQKQAAITSSAIVGRAEAELSTSVAKDGSGVGVDNALATKLHWSPVYKRPVCTQKQAAITCSSAIVGRAEAELSTSVATNGRGVGVDNAIATKLHWSPEYKRPVCTQKQAAITSSAIVGRAEAELSTSVAKDGSGSGVGVDNALATKLHWSPVYKRPLCTQKQAPIITCSTATPAAIGPAAEKWLLDNQTFIEMPHANKFHVIFPLVSRDKKQVVVCCWFRNDVEDVCKYLTTKRVLVTKVHGGLYPEQRKEGLQNFIRKKVHVLVITGSLLFGMDFPFCWKLINFDFPINFADYKRLVGLANTVTTFVNDDSPLPALMDLIQEGMRVPHFVQDIVDRCRSKPVWGRKPEREIWRD